MWFSWLREEISGPMGMDIHFGVQEADLERVSDIKNWGVGTVLCQSVLPSFMGRKMAVNIFDMMSLAIKIRPSPGRGTIQG